MSENSDALTRGYEGHVGRSGVTSVGWVETGKGSAIVAELVVCSSSRRGGGTVMADGQSVTMVVDVVVQVRDGRVED